jgi:hypothetical protein
MHGAMKKRMEEERKTNKNVKSKVKLVNETDSIASIQ